MGNNKEILQELQQISPLLVDVQNKNPYSILPEYFSAVHDDILKKLQDRSEPLNGVTRRNPYTSPANYFEHLPTEILSKIERYQLQSTVFEEMEAISPLLNKISKEPVYSVPENYFKQTGIAERKIGKTATVVRLSRRTKLIRYAAAMVIGVVSIGLIFKESRDRNIVAMDNSHPRNGVQKLTEQEIITFLKTNSPTENPLPPTNSPTTKDNDITISVSKIPDEDIKQFLRENGVEVEM